MARPSKLTPDVEERIVSAIRAGNYAAIAALSAGIDERTYYRWLERGEAGEEPFCQFRQSVTRASAEAEVHAVAIIRRAMADDWRAAVEYLKRRHPDRWQDRSKSELGGADGEPITVKLAFDPDA